MAKQATVSIPAGVWTQITTGDSAADFTLQNVGDQPLFVIGTAGATQPADTVHGDAREKDMIPARSVAGTLLTVWPGVTATRIYGWAPRPTKASISHD